MNEQISKYLKPIQAFWGKLSKKTKIIFFCVLGAVILGSFIIVAILNTQSYMVLYSGLEDTEVSDLITKLSAKGVTDVQVKPSGTLLVPKEQEAMLRMDLAMEGYPRSASNYDFFKDNINIMTTDFEKRNIIIYQLNERLAAAIKTFDAVKDAIVTISVPESNSYAFEVDKINPSASVVLSLVEGVEMTSLQVNGIKKLVVTSVPGLSVDNISVVDSKSGTEMRSSENMTQMDISALKMEIEKQFEDEVKRNIKNVLEPALGVGNIEVAVKSIMNVDTAIREIITYVPEENGKGVVNTEEIDKEAVENGTVAGNVVGATTNADIATYPGVTLNGNTISIKDKESYNYLVSQVKEQIQHEAAELKNLSISVVIDDDVVQFTPEKMQDLKQVVANAAATDVANVAMLTTPFLRPTSEVPVIVKPTGLVQEVMALWGNGLFRNIIYIISGLMGLLLILMTLFAIVGKSRKNKLNQLLLETADLQPALIPGMGAEEEGSNAQREFFENELNSLRDTKEQTLKKEIKDFADKNPEIAAQLIKTWLRGDEDDNV